MKIEIRCCCEGRLRGYVDIQEPCIDSPVILGGLRFQYTHLKTPSERILALKSNDYTESELRRIPEFKPATFAERVADAERIMG